MKVFAVLAVLVCLFALAAPLAAQDYPKGDLFVGYSFLYDTDTTFPIGWNAAVSGNFNSWFGIVADVSQHFGSTEVTELVGRQFVTFDVNMQGIAYRFGPRFTLRSDSPVEPFTQVLVGGFRATGSVDAGPASVNVSANGLAAGGGAGIDVRLGRRVALRAVQADYIFVHNSDLGSANDFRFSTGVVFRF